METMMRSTARNIFTICISIFQFVVGGLQYYFLIYNINNFMPLILVVAHMKSSLGARILLSTGA